MHTRQIVPPYLFYSHDIRNIPSIDGALIAANVFKHWVEENKGWRVIQDLDSQKREIDITRMLQLAAISSLRPYNLDISCEVDDGNGYEDLKISRGNDKTIVEVKLTSNTHWKHGYENQIWRYTKASNAEGMVFILIDAGNPDVVDRIVQIHEQRINSGQKVPELIIIDAKKKKSASRV